MFVPIEAVIESDPILWLRVCLADEEWLKSVFKLGHEHICFIISVYPSTKDELAKLSEFPRECLLKERLTANNKSLRDFWHLCYCTESAFEIWIYQWM